MELLQRVRNWLFSVPGYGWPGCDISLPGGVELQLVGSVHMGTPDMTPLPAVLLDKLTRARALIVEADIINGGSPFGVSDDMPQRQPLHHRLDQQLYQQTAQRARQLAISLHGLTDKPAWQVALILQACQAQQLGFCADYGIDYQLLQAAHGWHKPVIELEGSDGHLTLLSQLPQDGEGLLRDTLQHWHDNARLLQLMASWWTGTTPKPAAWSLPEIFSDGLHNALLRKRNQQWNRFLRKQPAGCYIVVVGALHLYGADNLPTLLNA